MKPQVIDRRSNGHDRSTREGRQPLQHPRLVKRSEMSETGRIKWYDPERRFGFIVSDEGGEVFLHRSVVQQYGIRESELFKGTPVRFVEDEQRPGQRPCASAIAVG